MRDLKKADKLLLLIIIVYSIFGLIMIFSASSASTILRYNYSSSYFFVHQLVTLIVGFIGGFIILLIPTRKYKLISYVGVVAILIALIYVLAVGHIAGGAKSWFRVGFFRVQPSEFAKTITILGMAYFYNFLQKNRKAPLGLYFLPLVVVGIMAMLITMQSDWGGAFILVLIAGLTFLSVPEIRRNMGKIMKIGIGGIAIVSIIFFANFDKIVSSNKLKRFNFANPCQRYQEDTGYQVCNGFIAISNGGLLGVGLGKSSQKYMYLPESHTDFIFPIIVEELGALVGCIIILGYGIFLFEILRVAKNADNLRNSIIAYGSFWFFASHILVNLLGALALIPLTGVPLPFLSYGGSFTLNAFVLSFLVIRVSIENKKNKLSREIASL